MNNLIPVRRMNKNGVLTTKWVTPPSEDRTGLSSIPAPNLSGPATKIFSPQYNTEIETTMTEVGHLHGKHTLKDVRPLDEFDLQAIQAVELMVHKAQAADLSWQAENSVTVALNIIATRITRGEHPVDNAPFNNLAVFGEAVITPDAKHRDVESLVLGISREFPDTKDFLLQPSDEERIKAVALVTAAARIEPPFVTISTDFFYADDRSIGIRSDILSQFIMTHPDDASEIARIVNERKTDDVDTIREVLSYGKHALRDGTL